jgi:MSHA biogenesis protein MshK
MVEHLMKKMIKALFLLVTLLFAVTVRADALKDPTQPPAALDTNADNNTAESIAANRTLQSVMLGPQYKAAIINGQKVFLGNKFEQSTLIKLNENSAVLRNQDGTTQILTMDFGAIKKTNVAPTDLELNAKNNVKRIKQNKAKSK